MAPHPIDDRRGRRHLQQIDDVGFADVTYTDERLNEAIETFLTRLAVPLASPSPSPSPSSSSSPDLVVASAVDCPQADAAADAAADAVATAESAGKEETRRWWG